jgi:hypothetical protein
LLELRERPTGKLLEAGDGVRLAGIAGDVLAEPGRYEQVLVKRQIPGQAPGIEIVPKWRTAMAYR